MIDHFPLLTAKAKKKIDNKISDGRIFKKEDMTDYKAGSDTITLYAASKYIERLLELGFIQIHSHKSELQDSGYGKTVTYYQIL